MREHPDLLNLSLSALQCINRHNRPAEASSSPSSRVRGSPALRDETPAVKPSVTAVSVHSPDEYERTSYYNGIAAYDDHPELIYRSDFHSTPFPRPDGTTIPVKSTRGVFNTSLNDVWDTVSPQICDLIQARKINWSCIDPARFFTYAHGEDTIGSVGPVVIWIGVIPGSTSADTAHEVSAEILALLSMHGVEDVVVEWREAPGPVRLLDTI